jgi:signal transduction histidine kinase
MQSSIFRRLWLATFAFLALVVLGLVASGWLTAREQQRLRTAEDQLAKLHEFGRVHVLVAQRLITIGRGGSNDAVRREIVEQIDRLIALATHPDSPGKLQAVRVRVERRVMDRTEVAETLILFNEVDTAEDSRETAILAGLEQESIRQQQLELAIPVAVLAVGVLLLPMARRRIIKPLDAFGRQLSRLADGKFTPARLDDVDPFVLPLHRQFNTLAGRLQELETAHRARTESLEAEVRATTRALLEQHRALARSERLAATGELAASVAHELRNPLAGIQMTLTNLRRELHDPELVERVDLVLAELTRLTRLLNDLLDTARHAPETPREVRLAELVGDIVSLTRCQLPAEVRVESQVPADLVCRLPQDRLRQALLNLVLNAAAALGGRGTVTIDAEVSGDRLRIRVADDGPGFPPELLERGIRPFFSTRERGTGLGLSMVSRFARDLGGEVQLANREPHGAAVTLVLPADAGLNH